MQFYESNISDIQIETCNMPHEANKLAHLDAYILLNAYAYVNVYVSYIRAHRSKYVCTYRKIVVLNNNVRSGSVMASSCSAGYVLEKLVLNSSRKAKTMKRS